MKKVTRRAIAALVVAAFVITGVFVYCFDYVKNGAVWASYFGVSNVTGTSTITDRNGVVLASETGGKVTYAADYTTRLACYQTVGDLSGNVGTGALTMTYVWSIFIAKHLLGETITKRRVAGICCIVGGVLLMATA